MTKRTLKGRAAVAVWHTLVQLRFDGAAGYVFGSSWWPY